MDSTSAAPAAPVTSTSAPAAKAPAAPAAKGPVVTTKPQLGTKAPAAPSDPTTQAHGSKISDDTHPPAQETAAEKKARLLKYKVDGKELSVDVDSLSDEELATKLQFAEAARVRMQEAAQVRKAWSDLQAALKEDPFGALKDALGVDAMKMAEERLIEQFRQEQLPEAEREKIKIQQELEQYKAQVQSYHQQMEQQRQEQLQQQLIEKTQQEFGAALETGLLPKNRYTMALMAEVADAALANDLELSPQQIAAQVNERLQGINKHVFSNMKGEQLVKYLGDDVVKEVLKFQVSKVRAKPPEFVETPAQVAASDDIKVSKADFKKTDRGENLKNYLRDIKRGR